MKVRQTREIDVQVAKTGGGPQEHRGCIPATVLGENNLCAQQFGLRLIDVGKPADFRLRQ